MPWLRPYPDQLLDAAELAIEKETIELVFLVVIQQLPPRQRAVLILRDVVGWTTADTAWALDMTVAGVKSAPQRARETLRLVLPARRDDWRPEPAGPDDAALLKRYIAALEHADRTALAEVLSADVRLTMPPEPAWYAGRDNIVSAIAEVAFTGDFSELHGVATRANRQPAVAWYHRRPDATEYEAFAIDVLRIDGGLITEITGFGELAFRPFGLTDSFPAADPS